MRILVIEDDLGTAAEIASALGDAGFEADCAHTGRDGLLQAAAGKYDAVVLDRMLPGDLDGLGVLSTLRTIGVEPRATLLVTGRPCHSRTCRMMLPSRLPSVSIFDDTTIGSASAAARSRAASAARSIRPDHTVASAGRPMAV